jgi:hypothetical protein
MVSADLPAEDQDQLVASAREMFQTIYDISNELEATSDAGVPAAAQ